MAFSCKESQSPAGRPDKSDARFTLKALRWFAHSLIYVPISEGHLCCRAVISTFSRVPFMCDINFVDRNTHIVASEKHGVMVNEPFTIHRALALRCSVRDIDYLSQCCMISKIRQVKTTPVSMVYCY